MQPLEKINILFLYDKHCEAKVITAYLQILGIQLKAELKQWAS